MVGAKTSFDEAVAKKTPADSRHNDRSTIAFPYLDLDTAVTVAKAVFDRAGLGDCSIDELAGQMKQTVSGAFRLKTATTKSFGFLDKGDRASFKLSELGRRVVTSTSEADARATAFLQIPLFKAIFEKYRGHLLPPPKALEREMGALGVAPKQTDKARQTFERSARQAGFFAQGEERLVQPRINRDSSIGSVTPPPTDSPQPPTPRYGGGSGNGGIPPSDQPLEYQLIDLLKAAGIGDEEKKAIWTLVQFLAAGPTGGTSAS